MNDLVHYAAGVLVAGAFGFTGRRRLGLGLFAVAPDWDVLTTPLVPFLITWLGLDHAQGHALVIALGHGAFSHSILATSALVGLGYLGGLRGRSLAAAAAAVGSHYPLDFVLTWSVWPFLPFSDKGIAWGVVTSGDLVVSALAIFLALVVAGPDAWRSWRRRRGEHVSPPVPAWVSLAGLVVLAAALAAPAFLQHSMLREHFPVDDAVADPVTYTTHALIATGNETFRMRLVDARQGVIGEMTIPRERDDTGGEGAAALDLVRRALEGADAPSPLVRPAFRARGGEEPGEIVVEAREASSLLAAAHLGEDEAGLDFVIDREGRVRAIHARVGELSTRVPVESMPLWVPIRG